MVGYYLVVFQRLGDIDGRRQVSSLRSVRSMLGRVYPNLGENKMEWQRRRGESHLGETWLHCLLLAMS